MTSKIRPWQGTVLGALGILGIVALCLDIAITIFMFVGGGFLFSHFASSQGAEISVPMISIFATMGIFMLVLLIPFLIFQIYLTKGLFSGRRWTVTISLIFTGFFALGIVPAIFQVPSDQLLSVLLQAVPIGFLLYLEVVCIKHPYYAN